MKRIEAIARITDQGGGPAGGLKVKLQFFSLAGGTWQEIADGSTDADGSLRLAAAFEQPDDRPAPNLRLLRVQGGAVLSDGGPIRFDRNKGVLAIDFGEIVDLGDQTVAPVVLDPRFRRAAFPIGGVSAPAAAAVAPAAFQPQLHALNSRVGTLQSQLEESNREKQELSVRAERAGALEAQLIEANREKQELGQRAARSATLETDLVNANRVNQQLSRDVARVPVLEAQLNHANLEVTRLQGETAQLDELKRRLDAAQKENERLAAPAEKKIGVTAMATNLGEQIGSAQRRIAEQPGALALAGVRVRLKGIVEEGAATVTLPDKEDLARPDFARGLAEFDMDFKATPSPQPDAGVAVPDVRRMTEGAVRQVLHSLGLRLEAVQGPPGSGGVAAGQAALQAPKAGERTQRGATVTVVFAT